MWTPGTVILAMLSHRSVDFATRSSPISNRDIAITQLNLLYPVLRIGHKPQNSDSTPPHLYPLPIGEEGG